MQTSQRRSTPKVVNGKVQRKHKGSRPRYLDSPQIAIERSRPGTDYRHVLKRNDVFNFINLIPDWKELSLGLGTILLAPGEDRRLGWFRPRIVAVCAMPNNLQIVFDRECYYRDKDFFELLNVSCDDDCGDMICQFSERSARCFQLMRVLLHEFGHHHDRITNKRGWASRGEDYAESFGRRLENSLWKSYLSVFGDPRR